MLQELIEKNRKEAFEQYVKNWKHQDPNTIEIQGNVFTYKTKRGIVKKFIATNKVTKLKVNSFYFEPVNT